MADLQSVLRLLGERIQALPELLLSPDSRLYWGYLGAALLLALIPWLRSARASRSLRDFLRFALPARVYTHPSLGVDLAIVLFNQLILPTEWLLQGLTIAGVAELTRHTALNALPAAQPGAPALWTQLLAGAVLFALYDLARFVCHWFHHRIPWLWRFHAIHHGAEELNPLTTLRFHPLELLLESLCVIALVGPAAGVLGALLGADPLGSFEWILVWFYLRAFNLLGATLRHTHVWLDWGPVLSHVLISPAQHQIHHSTASRHIDHNFGVCFSIWDWICGTLYVPREREELRFGIVGESSHPSLGSALLRPFAQCARDACDRFGAEAHAPVSDSDIDNRSH
jgi:sterol desaturase/sphingolipid hydroxylase (fatty acid hydroxylase superfamily)